MAFHPLSWLLHLAVLCPLVLLLAGQQHASNKCSNDCKVMTKEIPRDRLASYQRTEPSCRKRAIILTTRKNRTFCADPKEKWVQEAMEYLDRKAGPSSEKLTGPIIAPAITGTTKTTNTTATSWQSSYQPRVDHRAEGKASEAASTQTPPTQALPTDPPSTQVLPTDPPSTQAPSTQAPSTQALLTDPPSTQAGSIQNPPTDTPSPQAASPQAPAIPHTAPDPGQDLTLPQSPLGSRPAHPDAVTGPRVSAAPSKEQGSSDGQRQDDFPTTPEATRRQAVGLLAFLGLLFCLGVATLTYQRLQGCPRGAVGDMVEGLRYVPRSCGSNSYVLVPV
ncbi:fractalkine [Pipistrellus kuhlii]|uniref:fractalkine n=1 Tax=Pipistrellus kuhlii TaxID=59472 RepID=UPI001E26F626|nr:fractalkine [Pipistrellus kuhlii]